MEPILRHTTLFPPHPGIEFSPWKRVNSANMSLQNLYYEISCYFRNGQNFHISTYSYHSVPLPKFTLGYRLQLLITFLTIFKRYIGIFWKIRKALSNPKLLDCIAKCYDYILNNRLMKWYIPCREQAGGQEKRGCIEHIVTVRLVIDRCLRLKIPLFIVFVDFSKAYD